jgi:hypothetical protein
MPPAARGQSKLKIKNEKLKIKNGSCVLRTLLVNTFGEKRKIFSIFSPEASKIARRAPLPFLIFNF